MSTLTKILIVLLTVCSIFLCGIVLTYVGTTENYKQQFEDLKKDQRAIQSKISAAQKESDQTKEQKQQLEDKLNNQIADLNNQLNALKGQLATVDREKAALLTKVDGFASQVQAFTATNNQQGELLAAKLAELKGVEAKSIDMEKELNETSQALLERLAIIDNLKAERKNLLTQQADLEGKLAKYLQPMGREIAVTAPAAIAQSVQAVADTRAINLNGLIRNIDNRTATASINLGMADGVKKNMKFYVTRGNQFICEIAIIAVDAEQSVGTLKLVQVQPQIGDNVSTNL